MSGSVAREAVAVALIVDDGGQLLLQLRDAKPGVPAGGMWGLFGGHVEAAERAEDAVLRELQEELGWRPQHFERYLTREVGDQWHVTSHVFAAHLDVTLDELTLGEGQAMRLFAPDALPETIVPGMIPVVAEFVASDAYKRMRRSWDWITAGALLVDREGRFLLQHRDDKPDITNPGLWGSFGGRVEPYETPDDGFLRELQEELSWQPSRYRLYGAFPYRPPGNSSRNLAYLYEALVDVPADQLVLGEGQGMAFFAPGALPAGTVPELETLIHAYVDSGAYERLLGRR